MKITVSQLRRIIREEVEKNLTESSSMPLKDDGVVNSETGEILDMVVVPPQYLDYVEVDEMGYTTLPNDKFDELRGELKGLSAGKPKKSFAAPFQRNVADVKKFQEARVPVAMPSKAKLYDPVYGGGAVYVHGAGKKPGTLKVGTMSGKEMKEVPSSSVKFDRGIDSEKYGIPYVDPYARLVTPDPQDVHDEFMMWVDKNGEVPEYKLAKELGVEPEQIDWNGTGLRVLNGVVTELIGDTPYRSDM